MKTNCRPTAKSKSSLFFPRWENLKTENSTPKWAFLPETISCLTIISFPVSAGQSLTSCLLFYDWEKDKKRTIISANTRTCNVLDTALSTLYIFSHVILPVTLWQGAIIISILKWDNWGTEELRNFFKGHTASPWQGQTLNPDSPAWRFCVWNDYANYFSNPSSSSPNLGLLLYIIPVVALPLPGGFPQPSVSWRAGIGILFIIASLALCT